MTRKNLQSIMNLAWRFVKNSNMTISEALKLSWKNAKVYRALVGNVVEFKFKKNDGSVRKAKGTINVQILTSTNSVPCGIHPYTKNPNQQAYFDIDKMQWRSYKRENLLGLC